MKRCGRAACKNDLSEMRPNAKWCSQKCAMRVRRGEKALQTRTGGPSGLQVSYERAVAELRTYLTGCLDIPATTADEDAREVLRLALSERQRARLDARNG